MARQISIGLRLTEDVLNQFGLGDANRTSGEYSLNSLLEVEQYRRNADSDVVWFDIDITPRGDGNAMVEPSRKQFESAMVNRGFLESALSRQSMAMTSTSSSDVFANYSNIFRAWAPWSFIPDTRWVGAVREITTASRRSPSRSSIGSEHGGGLIDELFVLQNPGFAEDESSRAKFYALTKFVRSIVGDPTANIRIPHDRSQLLVSIDGTLMPLESLGTGISEIIVLAAATTIESSKFICIEEPEVHLHPTIQRKLIQYLYEETDNRYLISTHSAALLDSQRASISHVVNSQQGSVIETVSAPKSRVTAIADLGNRASDLVQSNFVVWVEGPSDRIYIVHWLFTFAPELVESAHYSVMFYGGALLSHLTAADEEVDEFIQLARINQHFAVIIDSDRSSSKSGLNATKDRVLRELNEIGAIGWVTDGYTIENYVPRKLMAEIIEQKYPERAYELPVSEWTSPLSRTFESTTSKPSKVTVARAVAAQTPEPDIWSPKLQEHIRQLADRIRVANGL